MKYSCSNWRNQYTLKLRKRLRRPAFRDWDVRRRELFGQNSVADLSSDESCTPGDMYCFTLWHYTHFLDEVKSIADLIEGLFQLSPFADDALEVALGMSESDFIEFKLELVQGRKAAREGGESVMLERYYALLLPNRFPMAIVLADKARVSLGVALIRLMETELGL